MRTLAVYLPALACGAMMLLICILMMRKMHKGKDREANAGTQRELAELRDEVGRLRAQSVLNDDRESIRG